MLQILLPAAAAAGVVILVGILISTSDWGDSKTTERGKDGKIKTRITGDDSGMSDSMPPLEAPEWKPAEGGMKIWDVKEGEGPPCPRKSEIVIHYTGWTTDGRSFDSSRKRGQPTPFQLAELIKGWQEGIPGMKPGGIRRLMIPYEMGYGERGEPRAGIPSKATLVFEVKFLGNP